MPCEIVDGGAFATVYKYCRTHKCEPTDCPKTVIKSGVFGIPYPDPDYCEHQWDWNNDACKHCGMSGVEYLYGPNQGRRNKATKATS